MFKTALITNKVDVIIKSRYFLGLLIFFCLSLSQPTLAQTESITEVDYNRDSRSAILAINNNGFTLGYRLSKRKDGFRSRLIDFDFSYIKHPKEIRINSAYDFNKKYVYGKLNHAYNLKISYGRKKELFGKYSQGGIAIDFYYSVGMSVVWLKPIYYTLINDEEVPFDKYEYLLRDYIVGKSSYFKGFLESQFAFGGFIKASVVFNVNKKYNAINEIELSILLDYYHRDITIMATEENYPYLLTLSVGYRFGKKRDSGITTNQ
ncbi:MAG: hypothetical protein JXR60_05510 [Bacteroidales bacterium]|nr:hypothetical protein [Bacteroidales bacterium]